MPDLDQMKQEEQEHGTGMGGFPTAGRAIPPGRPTDTGSAGPGLAGGRGHSGFEPNVTQPDVPCS
jgi:hypothetical protein